MLFREISLPLNPQTFAAIDYVRNQSAVASFEVTRTLEAPLSED